MDQGFSKFGATVNLGQKIQKIEADSMRQFSEQAAILDDVQQRIRALDNERPLLQAKVAELETGLALAESAATSG